MLQCPGNLGEHGAPQPTSRPTLGWVLVVGGVALASIPCAGPFWVAGSLLLASGALWVALRSVGRARSGPARLGLLVVGLVPLTGLRSTPEAVAWAGWLLAGAALALACSATGERGRRGLLWALSAVAAASLLSVAAVETLCTHVGSVFFHEVWDAADVGLLSPFRWSELAGPLGAMALPLTFDLARSSGTRRARVASYVLGWLVVSGLALGGHFTSWVVAAGGLVWLALLRGGRARSVGIAALVVAVALAAVAWVAVTRGPASRVGKVRVVARALGRASADWWRPASYVWETDLSLVRARPWLGHGLLGYPAAYGEARAEEWLPPAGVERPSTARCDVLQSAVESGLVSVALSVVVGLWLLLRSRVRDPYVSAALCAGVLAMLLGHAFGTLNGWGLWVLLGLAARPPDAEAPSAGRWYGAVPASAAVVLSAVALWMALALPPSPRIGRAERLERLAEELPAERHDLLARAAMVYSLRWEALAASATATREERASARAAYARFCATYEVELLHQGRPDASRAYGALREGLLAGARDAAQ